MSTWIKVARYQLTDRYIFVASPWLILALDFLINLVTVASLPAGQHQVYVGALSAIYVVLLTSGALAIARQLPFALALRVSRRSFYAGSALLCVALAAVYGLGLTVLQLIERGTGGWGLAGLLSFIAAQVLVLAVVLLGIGAANAWHGVGRFFTTLTIEGLTGLLAAAAVALLAGGYGTVRRLAV